jgi:hypothetical protein
MAMQPPEAVPRTANHLVHKRSSEGRVSVSRGYASFRLPASNGYRILVEGSSEVVRLVAFRRHEAASYLYLGGGASQDGIQANLGRLGRIDLRFHPTKEIALSDGCSLIRGKPPSYGYFTGTFKFRGESNFTHVHRRQKIYGQAWGPLSVKCPGSSPMRRAAVARGVAKPEQGPKLLASYLDSSSSLGFRSLAVGGNAFSSVVHLLQLDVPLNLSRLPRKGVPYSAEVFEIRMRARLMITRVLVARGPADSFSVAASGNEATVKPPKPFSGEAEYRLCRRFGPVWRGSLRVSLPGIPNMVLAGKKFFADLDPGKKCPPEKRAPR